MKRKVCVLIAVTLGILLVSVPAWAVENPVNNACISEDSGCHALFHADKVAWLESSSHVDDTGMPFDCVTCHEGAANHGGNMSNKTTVHFDLEVCSGCHPDQYGTYIYGDDWKTKYGGSPGPDAVNHLPNGDTALWNKLNDFANYNDIIDGYGFTREYNEERSHNVMIQDHHDISRGKKDTCLQCKSTKLAYYWGDDSLGIPAREVKTLYNVDVMAGHMNTADYPNGITIPKGTRISMYTHRPVDPQNPDDLDPTEHESRVLVIFPIEEPYLGKTYASFDYPGATKDGNVLWAALYALTVNELPPGSPTIASGNGCNHCHDPHKSGFNKPSEDVTTGFRIIRKSLKYAIQNNHINPYDLSSAIEFNGDDGLDMNEGIALCAQCHVEYVCGNSPIDGIDRDFFSWAKVFELEDVYANAFAGTNIPGFGDYSSYTYVQDWVHGTGKLSSPKAADNGVSYTDSASPIREELIKSQHPEAETYWESRHYGNDAPCFLCHMPKVTKTDGTIFTSHWLASPNKYMDPEPAGEFAYAFSIALGKEGIIPPCGACHGGKLSRMKDKATRIQDGIYDDALVVQAALVESLRAIKAAKDAGDAADQALLDIAADEHRAAHVRWENLVVSENSMGFHNPSEVSTELHHALTLAQSAKQNAEDAIAGLECIITEDPESTCDDGIDNDCDGLTDGADSDCGSGCTVTEDPESTCDDGLDNDCDGLTDEADLEDCPVTVDCYLYDGDKTTCNSYPDACSWSNKDKTCSSIL
jgi:formate-dependent nitrite reductase cytochrome c552 subunit